MGVSDFGKVGCADFDFPNVPILVDDGAGNSTR